MKLLVGLGNPDESYAKTRHNVGHLLIDEINQLEGWKLEKNNTFMNSSGKAVRELLSYYHLTPQDLVVLHDDWVFELGTFKVQRNRGASGHNGVQNIIDVLGTKDFWRIRVGIGAKPDHTILGDYVLSNFKTQELNAIKALSIPIVDALKQIPFEG
ncbi:peptidyl-tRNA hydrolase [candidate division WWE3 bacterium]|nr:peptidyl-tRNA hydrolase [candidate division WWE3 bacterium]